jgi:hypothetical protein
MIRTFIVIAATAGFATCGDATTTEPHPASAYDPCWCYADKTECQAGSSTCLSPENFAVCYLDAEQRGEIAAGAPDTRPEWCFGDAGTPR